jgi:hypothetical protein
MFLFPGPTMHPLIIGLKQMPEDLTLMEFKDELRELFLKLYQQSPDSFENKNTKGKETFIGKLARSFECDPTIKKPAKVKNEALNGSIRTIRHMIYNHDIIKDGLEGDGQKKKLIPYYSRLQILLAKRLSTLRIIKEQRESILSRSAPDLENLLIMEDQEIKDSLSDRVERIDGVYEQKQDYSDRGLTTPPPIWKRDGRQTYRLRLTPGVALEIDPIRFHPENSRSTKNALAKYLEVMFRIEPGSESSEDIITQIIKASSGS